MRHPERVPVGPPSACLAGAFEFYDGRDPNLMTVVSIAAALYQTVTAQIHLASTRRGSCRAERPQPPLLLTGGG